MDILTANDAPGAHAPSWYAATAKDAPRFAAPTGDMRADVAIVGGGVSGLSAALHLAERGYDVALLEANRVGWGASGRNGGQVGIGMRLDQDQLEAQLGLEAARGLWSLGLEAAALTRALAERLGVDAHYAPGVLYTLHRAAELDATRAYVERLARDYDHHTARCLDAEATRAAVATQAYHGAMLELSAGHLHPLRFAHGLARAASIAGARLHEGARVREIAPQRVILTNGATLRASHVLLACNGYHNDIAPELSAHVMPINSYVVATEPLGEARARALIAENRAVSDSKFVVNYFRMTRDHRLLFGGTESYRYRFPKDIAGAVRRPMTKIFPQLKEVRIDYAWGGVLGITMSRLPHVARLASGALSVSGFSGHGLALGTLSGKLAAEAVAGEAERFDLLARAPTPAFPGGALARRPMLALGMLWFALRDRI